MDGGNTPERPEPYNEPYNIEEINKIRREIERDLRGPDAELTAPEPAELSAPVADGLNHAPFYQETIKPAPDAPQRRSVLKTVAVICLVCTLGTASLGFGIGMSIPIARYYLAGGINGRDTGDNPDATPQSDAGGASYYFNNEPAESYKQAGALSDIIRMVEPSVCSITSVFENAGGPFFSNTPRLGEASGIIFAEDSRKVYIATNNHVVSGASAVRVSIMGSEPLSAKPAGRDAEADLAVISVEKRDLSDAGITSIVIAVFGNSDAMEIGDSVLAIGNALGEGNSATYGIISSNERVIPIQGHMLTVLQTDAAINPGSNGGPLVNMRGEVIGINTLNYSDYYYIAEGMSFSISSNAAKPILEDILTAEPRPFLGVSGETVTEEMAERFDIPPIGVLITNVIEDTAAEKAGMQIGDIVTSFNGGAVFTWGQLVEDVGKCKVNDTVEIKILRDGKTPVTLSAKLGFNNQDTF